MKSAIVLADFYPDIAEGLLESCRLALTEAGMAKPSLVRVPGALEIPFALQTLARSKVDVLVALGCVIRGETRHFDIVSDICARGILRVQLDFNAPIGNGVLTAENKMQALARLDKGGVAAKAALTLAQLKREIPPIA